MRNNNQNNTNSSAILNFSYDERNRNLKIRFASGGQYTFFNIPQKTFDALSRAKSKGRYFMRNIRNTFAYSRGSSRKMIIPVAGYERKLPNGQRVRVRGYERILCR